jgi:DNA-binding MarR family transcriptional regulator
MQQELIEYLRLVPGDDALTIAGVLDRSESEVTETLDRMENDGLVINAHGWYKLDPSQR